MGADLRLVCKAANGSSVWFALRDPRTPWAARVAGALVVAYALSPIDLIPDFIPALGLFDDLILLPLVIVLIWIGLAVACGIWAWRKFN